MSTANDTQSNVIFEYSMSNFKQTLEIKGFLISLWKIIL